MANIDHQSVVGSNDSGIILRPNVRNQGHLEHISSPFTPTKLAWGQEGRCTIPFQEPGGTHGVIDDLYMTFRIGLDTAGATLTQLVAINVFACIESISIENEGTKLFEIAGRGAVAAVMAEESLAMAQHLSNECFVDHWSWYPSATNTSFLMTGDATHEPTLLNVCLPLNRLTNGMFKNFRCSRLTGITVVVKLVGQPGNSANIKETLLFVRNGAGTAAATQDPALTWCMQGLALRAEKTVYESDVHLQPLSNPVRYLSHGYSVIPIAVDLSLATAQTIQLSLGHNFGAFENLQRLLIWWSDLGQTTAAPQVYNGADGRMVRYLQQFWLTDAAVYAAGKSDGLTGYRVFRNNKLILDGTGTDQRMINWARSCHRRHGVQRVSDCHQNVFINSPTTIDLCPCAGHTMPGKSADSHVLSGHKNDKSGEYLVEIYLAAGTGVTGQFGGVLWCALEYQTCIEIENNNQPASEQRPIITRLVN